MMIKLFSLFLVFVYLSPAQSCYHCELSEFCLNNGAVYDRLSNQVCILGSTTKKHGRARNCCKKIHDTADVWIPTNRTANALANLYPGTLRTGNPTLTWTKSFGHILGKIAGNGNTVAIVPFQRNPRRKRIICCIEAKRSLFSSRIFRIKFTNTTSKFTQKFPPKTAYCTNSTSDPSIRAPVTAYETNSETDANPVTNLFINKEYKSAEKHKSPTYIIQYFLTKNTVQTVEIVSTVNLPSNLQIYAGSKFEEDKNITEYTQIADRTGSQPSRSFAFKLQKYNCYHFIILYVPTLEEQLCLTQFIAWVAADGRTRNKEGIR